MKLTVLFHSLEEYWNRFEKLFFEKSTTSLTKITFLFIPIILIASWQIFVFWTLGMSGWWASLLGILIIIFGLAFAGKNLSFQYSDIRWLLAPFVIFLIAWYVPWWDYHHQRFDTGAYLFSALEFLEHSEFPRVPSRFVHLSYLGFSLWRFSYPVIHISSFGRLFFYSLGLHGRFNISQSAGVPSRYQFYVRCHSFFYQQSVIGVKWL